jgi:hypothetical protein
MTDKELKDQMTVKYGHIREFLQSQSKPIREAYKNEDRSVLEQKIIASGRALAQNLLEQYNRFLHGIGQRPIKFGELEELALAAICTCLLEAISELLRAETENKGERNWIKSEVHSCATNTSQVVHSTFGEKVAPRYIGNGVSRRAVLHVVRQFFGVNSVSVIRF